MNGYGYLFMNEPKNTIGWRCTRRDENCKAVIYTFKSTQQFSHWNGKFHSHLCDTGYTQKREILSKIKSRIIDEFIPIKVIIEDEYRKAVVSKLKVEFNYSTIASTMQVKVGGGLEG